MLLAAYGLPRETHDADHVVAADSVSAAVQALRAALSESDLVFREMKFSGVTITRISRIGGEKGRSVVEIVDLVTPRDPAFTSRVLARIGTGTLRGREIPLLRPEDYILLKLLSNRDYDLKDARSVLVDSETGPRIDRKLIEDEVDALSESISDHDIRARWRELLAMESGAPD